MALAPDRATRPPGIRPEAGPVLGPERTEQVLAHRQPVVEHLPGHVEQLEERLVPHSVADRRPLLLGLDDRLAAEDGELLRDHGLIEAQHTLELADRPLAGPEPLEDPDPGRVGEGLEELRLELM